MKLIYYFVVAIVFAVYVGLSWAVTIFVAILKLSVNSDIYGELEYEIYSI